MNRNLAFAILAAALLAPGPMWAQDTRAAMPELPDAAQQALASATEQVQQKAKEAVTFPQPLLVTDVGQGNNARLIEAILRRAQGVRFETDALAAKDKLEGVGTLVIGVGASTKGLGAAGLDANQEMERTKALVEAAKEKKIPVIGVHIGGTPRRGELSDGFNDVVMRASSAFIVWKEGDEDGFFSRIAKDLEIPLVVTETKPEVGAALLKLLESGVGAKAGKAKDEAPTSE